MFLASFAFAENVPKLEFEKTTFDFGKVTEGDQISGKFILHNAGDAMLKIQTPETSCGCTVASVKPEALQPGETGEISFQLDLTNARGPVKKTMTVPSNDPHQPKITLILAGDVKPLFEIDPEIVFFDEVPPGEPAREAIRVRRLDGKKLAIGKAELSRPSLRAFVNTNDGTTAELVVEAKGTGKAEEFSDILSVTLANAAKPAFHVPVAGKFVPSIKVEPSSLLWTGISEQKILVSSTTTNRPLMLGNIASTLEELLVKVDAVREGQSYEVTVKLPVLLPESAEGVLTFDTNFPDHPTITVPLRIVVLQP